MGLQRSTRACSVEHALRGQFGGQHVLYHWYELGHAAVKPARVAAGSYSLFLNNPFNPLTHMPAARHAAAACEVFERTTRRYTKPSFGIDTTVVDGEKITVAEDVVWHRPFCRLLHFRRQFENEHDRDDPKILLVAPMSGHYATLLRGTVEALLPDHDVYITDWQDARTIPLAAGVFDLDAYIDCLLDVFSYFQGDVHVFAVCQPAVPVLAAVSLMEEHGDTNVPQSIVLAGGPVDTRISPTLVNELAEKRGTDWFARNVITTLPWPNLGCGRSVYPGFLQLTGFMTMNLDRHWQAHKDLFLNLVQGDGDSAEKHRAFYDEYLAVMDLSADFYLQTMDTVFVKHALPEGKMVYRGRLVRPKCIRRVALMTIEGEKDDITGIGQCGAAHDLAINIPDTRRDHYVCPDVGHYGIFNGSRFRGHIAPRIARFIRQHDSRRASSHGVMPQHFPGFDKRFKSAVWNEEDLASAAFTFAPANDTRREERIKNSCARQQTTTDLPPYLPATGIAAAPFRWWVLAGKLMLEGMIDDDRKRRDRDTR